MNTILMFYVNSACKEYILPSIDNSDYKIILHKEIFNLREDVKIELEVMEGMWSFIQNSDYIIKREKEIFFGEKIENGQILEFQTEYADNITIIVIQVEKTFQVYEKYCLKKKQEITIGKAEDNTIQYDFNDLLSRKHARILVNEMECVIEDISANGVFCKYQRIQGRKKLEFGDCITAFGLHIIYLGEIIAISGLFDVRVNEDELSKYVTDDGCEVKSRNKKSEKKEYFHRSPRSITPLYYGKIQIKEAPDLVIKEKKPLILTIGPSFTMAIPISIGCVLSIMAGDGSGSSLRIIGVVTAVMSAIIAAIWATLNVKLSNKEEKKKEENKIRLYQEYLDETIGFIREKYESNRKNLLARYCSAKECCEYTEKTADLWNRNEQHEDYLYVRLGIGEIPFQGQIVIPEKNYDRPKDALTEQMEQIYEEYHMLKAVPVGIDLMQHRLFGIIGGRDKQGAIQIVQNIIAQIAAHNCYTEVKLVVAYNSDRENIKKQWAFAKWLPHIWAEDKKMRFFASNKEEASDIFYELTNIMRIREENEKNKDEQNSPHYIMFIDDKSLLDGELISKYVYDIQGDYGLTTILMVENYEDLPNECVEIVQNDEHFHGIFNVNEKDDTRPQVLFDELSVLQLESFTRRLSGIEVNVMTGTGDLPNHLEFLEMYEVSDLESLNVMERWRKHKTYDSLKAIIGKKAGGQDCYLDIHEKYHGPHGLIAGTTGSGKSELLQTYILSLAIDFSPDDVGFFIIDFKGGGMANLFSNLPHLVGQISNLSGNQVARAMVSIKSENRRRQQIFNEYGVNNINMYTRLFKNKEATEAIPHLFIIIDEFAELKREEPEFMQEIISVAQVGRSLGVHLILATQKPNGTVDDNIWSNSKFRLCLRVQSRQDSNDMLHKPDAAYLTQAGRAYLQVGNDEIFELFQSAWSGAVYDDSIMENRSDVATMLTVNGKTALIGNYSKIKQKEKVKINWVRTLLHYVQSSMLKLGICIVEVKSNMLLMESLISEIIQCLNDNKIEYQDTKYNRQRIKDFLYLWKDDTDSADQLVVEILRNSEKDNIKLPEAKEKTQLDAVVEYLAEIAEKNGYKGQHQLWMPLLPEKLFLEDLAGYKETAFKDGWKNEENWTLEAMIGLYDDPINQLQKPVTINFAENGHYAVCGTVVTGKSTFAQTLVYSLIKKYSPAHLNIYLLDFSSQMLGVFEYADHVGGVVFENSIDKLDKFFYMLSGILEERKKIMKGGNYSQYVKVNGVSMPAILIVIDNMANFREKSGDRYIDFLMELSRDASTYGIYIFITAGGFGMTEIPYKMASNIKNIVCLEMGDKYKYAEVLGVTRFSVIPEADVRGRGLVMLNGRVLEYQTALAFEASDDYARAELIKKECEKMNQVWTGEHARKIPEIQKNPTISDLKSMPEYQKIIDERRELPYGYNIRDASVATIELRKMYCYLISGKKNTGKNNMLKIFIHAISDMQGELCIIDTQSQRLRKIAEEKEATYLYEVREVFEYFSGLVSVFTDRTNIKKELLGQGYDEDEIFEQMRLQKPIFIVISDLNQFMTMVYQPSKDVGSMAGFLENITERGAMQNVFFIAALDVDSQSELVSRKAYKNMAGYKCGIHLGGNIGAQKIFTYNNISYKEENKVEKPGTGIVASKEDENRAVKVVLPRVK